MNDKQAYMAGAEAQQHLLDNQVDLFLFDLKNEATEHGFKPGESWTLELATEEEMLGLKRIHHPVVSLRLQPQTLLKAYQQIKNKLKQSLNTADTELTEIELTRNDKRHLAAYPTRFIRK